MSLCHEKREQREKIEEVAPPPAVPKGVPNGAEGSVPKVGMCLTRGALERLKPLKRLDEKIFSACKTV